MRRIPPPSIWVPVTIATLLLAAPAISEPDPATPSEFHRATVDPDLIAALPGGVEPSLLVMDRTATRGAAALPPGAKNRSTVLLLEPGGENGSTSLEVPGRVRALAFGPASATLFVLIHRGVKRGSGDTYLATVDFDTLKARKAMRLPLNASDLALSRDGAALLIAGQDEIRTVLIPGMRSGPLYAVPGRNLSIHPAGPGDRILVGQPDRVLLIDLADPPGEESMPLRGWTAMPAPVTRIGAGAGGDGTRLLLADGSVRTLDRARLEPLAAEVAPDVPPAAPEPAAPPRAAEPAPPEAEPASKAAAAKEPAQGAAIDEKPAITSPPAPSRSRPAQLGAPPEPTEPPAAPTAEPEDYQAAGRVEGPAAGQVLEVVLLGPDSVLREAKRVRPAADGRWSVSGLAPGRYRLQLSAGGERALVSSPAFVTFEIRAGQTTEVPTIRALRSL